MADATVDATTAAVNRMVEQNESVHAELLERMDKMETLLSKIEDRPQILPKFVTSTTFPGVLCGFSDYIGLAMITPALPFYLMDYFQTQPDGGLVNVTATGTIIPLTPLQEVKDTVTRWTGYITATQFICIFVANIFWATCGDRIPSMWALMVTMLGDTASFAGSGNGVSVGVYTITSNTSE